MSTSIIIKIVIDPRSDTEQQQSYIYLLTVGKNNNSAVLQTWKSFRSCWSLRDIHRCSDSLPQALLHQRRDLPHRMILHLYKAISTSIVVWNTMGKIKKTNADKTQQGSKQVGRPNAKLCFFVCLFFFFFSPPFCPSIGHQKNEKGSGRYKRRRERKKREKKEEKRKKREGGGRREKSVNFCFFFFFFFFLSVVWYTSVEWP